MKPNHSESQNNKRKCKAKGCKKEPFNAFAEYCEAHYYEDRNKSLANIMEDHGGLF